LFVLVVKDGTAAVGEQYSFVTVLEYGRMSLCHDSRSVPLPMRVDERPNQLLRLDHSLTNHSSAPSRRSPHVMDPGKERQKMNACDPYGLSTNADRSTPSYRIYGSRFAPRNSGTLAHAVRCHSEEFTPQRRSPD
jgi:hypothetical protein